MSDQLPILGLKPEALVELALQTRPPADILRDHGVPPGEIRALLADPTFQRMVEEERRRLEESEDLDAYYNRVCYRLLRNKLVTYGLADKLSPPELVKAVDMLRRHARMDTNDESPAAQVQQPVLNIIISTPQHQAPSPQAVTITTTTTTDDPNEELTRGVED